MKKKLLALLVVLAMVLSIVPAVYADGASMSVQITPSVSTASVGDTVDYTITATGNGITALQFEMIIPEGLEYVANSAAVPSTLKSYLGWAATDWTESSMMWTGYNDLPSEFGADTVILTFSCVVTGEGDLEIGTNELLAFDPDFEEIIPELTVGKVSVAADEPAVSGFQVDIKASATEVNVGDTIDYTVYAQGANTTALQFELIVPAGLTYVPGSAVVPSSLKGYLGWAATDWTESSMMWTGYNDIGSTFAEGTVILTFSCVAAADGTYEIATNELLAFDENFEEVIPVLNVDAVVVAAVEAPCEHSFTDYISDGNVTCTVDGTKTAVCDNGCGATDVIAETAKGHSFTNYVAQNDATCTADGTKVATCDNGCGETDVVTDAGTAKGHSFTNYVPAGDSTCLGAGTEIAECDNGCGKTDIKAGQGEGLGHSFTNYKPNNDATCTEDGTKTAVCDRCEETDTLPDVGSATGHSFTNYKPNNDATCTENGTETAKCDNCDETNTQVDVDSAIGHALTKVEATVSCTKAGVIAHYVCGNCGNLYEDATGSIPTTAEAVNVDALGHIDEDGDNDCDRDGCRFLLDGPFMYVDVVASKPEANVGDTILYTVYACGNEITALQFDLVIPEGMSYVPGSAAVPETLMGYLGWAATDWTEETMKWTGYNDIGAMFEEGTVILTFSVVVEAEGEQNIDLVELLPFDENFEEFPAVVSIDTVVSTVEPTEPSEPSEEPSEPSEPSEEPTEPSEPSEEPTKPSTKPDTDKEEIPKTGNDGMMIYFAVMMIAVFAVLFTVLMGKKKYEA